MQRKHIIVCGVIWIIIIISGYFLIQQNLMLRWNKEGVLTATSSVNLATTSVLVVNTSGELCLSEKQKVVYEVINKEKNQGKVKVSVLDTVSNNVEWSKEIEVPTPNVADGNFEGKCHFYLLQEINFDRTQNNSLPGYKYGVWKYDYFTKDNIGGVPMVIEYENRTGNKKDGIWYYGQSFSIDPSEKYISLERSYLGKDDYALVIKDINTGKDAYVLLMKDILKDHQNAVGSFDIGWWVERPDGVYLEGDIFDGSRWTAYYYIKRDTWETKIYETPADYQAGVERSAPPFAPYLAYTDVVVWTGMDIGDEAVIKEQITEGKKKHLIIANLTTGATTTIATVPIISGHRFDLKWLDDKTLEYSLPSGAKQKFTLSE